jgi:hypothetical protein
MRRRADAGAGLSRRVHVAVGDESQPAARARHEIAHERHGTRRRAPENPVLAEGWPGQGYRPEAAGEACARAVRVVGPFVEPLGARWGVHWRLEAAAVAPRRPLVALDGEHYRPHWPARGEVLQRGRRERQRVHEDLPFA